MRTPLVDETIVRTRSGAGATRADLRAVIHAADPVTVVDVEWRRPADPIGSVFKREGVVDIAVATV